MIDGVDVFERAADGSRVANVTVHQLDGRVEIGGPLRSRPMNLWGQEVERSHLVPPIDEIVGDVRANEAGAARDQNVHGSYPG